ncbi:MAG: site-specific integrase, partial [Gaiellaceae bacterium]
VRGENVPRSITVSDWQSWVAENTKGDENPKGLKGTSLVRYLNTACLILDFADIQPNTARDKRVKIQGKNAYEEVDPPTCKQFLAILDNVPQQRRLALIVMEQCAMAVGETSQLQWGDVDVAESKFRLRRSTVKGGIRTRARWVQVPRWLMDVIENTCPWEDRTPDRPVFGGTPNAYQGVMVRACKAAGIPTYTPHDLRHRRLSLWHGQGVPAAELAGRAGDTKSSMTLDMYSHVLLDPTEATEQELRALLAG